MRPTVVAWDIDDVFHPFNDLAHEACVIAGLVPKGTPNPGTWAPFESYGCSLEEWVDVLALATESGFLHGSTPTDEQLDAVARLKVAGVPQHFITARGFMAHGELVKQLTREWAETHFGGVYESLHFAKKKAPVASQLGVTHAIDDAEHNWHDLAAIGVEVYLMDQPWNRSAVVPDTRRVKSVGAFVDAVLNGAHA